MSTSYGRDLVAAVRAWLPLTVWASLAVHGNAVWTPSALAWMALLLAWQPEAALTDRYAAARDQVRRLRLGLAFGETYLGFTKAWLSWQTVLVRTWLRHFRQRLQTLAGRWWTLEGWVVFAVDGSRFNTARTAANTQALGCAGRTKTGPQRYWTVLWHVATGVWWDWRIGPGTASERSHLHAMRGTLPTGTLLLADAGFVSFGVCQALLAQGTAFLLRVGRNVRLLRGLGVVEDADDGTVYLWPEKHRKAPPLVLRRIVLTRGRQTLHLLTSVRDPAQLSDAQAARLYALRWGVEVGFRGVKQTVPRRQLRSHRPDLTEAELTWAALGANLLAAVAAEAQLRVGKNPQSWSLALAYKQARQYLRRAERRRPRRRGWWQQLAVATKDTYVRTGSKAARNWPHKKKEKPPGAPQITVASPQLVRQAQQVIAAGRAK